MNENTQYENLKNQAKKVHLLIYIERILINITSIITFIAIIVLIHRWAGHEKFESIIKEPLCIIAVIFIIASLILTTVNHFLMLKLENGTKRFGTNYRALHSAARNGFIYEAAIIVPKNLAETIKTKLSTEPKSENDCYPLSEKISLSAKFPNGYTADVEMCGVNYTEGVSNLPWTQCVLFNENNSEVTRTDPEDEFFCDWTIDYINNTYIIHVREERE